MDDISFPRDAGTITAASAAHLFLPISGR